MIWLASFPRSGNTYFRIILKEVYGISSSEFHILPNKNLDPNYQNFPLVKTHLLPHQLTPSDSSIPAIYIVRDGRDALVSIAHHQRDFVEHRLTLVNRIKEKTVKCLKPHKFYYEQKRRYYNNLKEAILADQQSYFGGWSSNVEAWLKRATIIIKYEDLTNDPISCIQKIRPILSLPNPKEHNLPSFRDLRTKNYMYSVSKKYRKKFFRRGISGAWKDEMPQDLQELFWGLHEKTMLKLGYTDELTK